MMIGTLAVLLAAFEAVAGHTVFTTLFVDDASQGDGTCVRMPMTPNTATFPINDLAGDEMACGFGGTTGVARVCSVSQGAKLSFLFREYPDASQPGAIDVSHKGPCAVYMKAVQSASEDKGVGDGWFKAWDDGYDEKTSQWCTEKLMKNNGLLSVTIPSDLAGGGYLVRPELLSLHEADKSPPNPQFYAGCAQIFLSSKATSKPAKTVSIPGHVSISDRSVLFNIYEPKWPYTLPGPARYVSGMNIKLASSSPRQSVGLLPNNVIATNANWWGVEVPSYTTEKGCYDAATNCWDQCTACYNSAPPTGSKNCKIWEAKCQGIDDSCNSGNFNGPPNKNQKLQVKAPVYSIPAVYDDGEPAAPSPEPASSTLASSRPVTVTIPLQGELVSTITMSGSAPLVSSTSNTEAEVPATTTIITSTVLSVVIIPAHPTSSSAPAPSTVLQVSTDARCGSAVNQTCLGSQFGPCCSTKNWCGMTDDYCGQSRCQAGFGKCGKLFAGGRRNVHAGRA